MAKRHSFETCMEKLIALVNGEEFLKMARSSSVDFTRNRKMGFASYIWYFLLHCARSLSTGLHAFEQAFRENDDVITKQGFSKGRRRIRPEAIAYLVDFTRDQFYKTAEAQLWNGYHLLSIWNRHGRGSHPGNPGPFPAGGSLAFRKAPFDHASPS